MAGDWRIGSAPPDEHVIPVNVALDNNGNATHLNTDSDGNLLVNSSGGPSGGIVITGQVNVTPTAQALPNIPCNSVTLQSSYANTAAGLIIYWGSVGEEHYEMLAGDTTAPINISNTNQIYVLCTSGDTALLNWFAEIS
jgi:hypothetical protein